MGQLVDGRTDDLKQVPIRTDDEGNVGIFGSGADGAFVLGASEAHIGQVGGTTTRPSASFTVPNSAATYAIGDLIANSATAGSVTPMTFTVGRITNSGGMLRRARLRKTGTGLTGASFRLHLYSASPTPSNGDDGVWLTNGADNYVGAIDITVDKVFTDGAAGNGLPVVGSEINFTAVTYYGLLEARGAYVRTAGETFNIVLEDIQN